MAQPTYAQYRDLTSSAAGLTPEDITNRIFTCLAAVMSGTNPDGTALVYPHP